MPSLPKFRSRSIRALTTCAASGLLLGALAATGSAATITVTNTNDTGPGSLRAAIAGAGSGDTIAFSSDVLGTITLTEGQIEIDKSLTITGPGAANLTLRGVDDRMFRIGDTVNAIDVTIEGLRFLRGKAASDGGGAIWSTQDADQTLTVKNSVFERNAGTSYGGAILLDDDAAMVISGSTFTDNATDDDGGAIAHFSTSPITITDSTFARNVTDEYGGAISLWGSGTPSGESVIENTTFQNNSGGADGDGGAIAMDEDIAPLTVSDSTFLRNRAGDDYDGGAIWHSTDAALAVENTEFVGNTAYDGGAVYSEAGDLTITDSLFEGNTAYDGGAVYSEAGDLTITDSLFEGNAAASSGAALDRDADGLLTISGTVFRANNTAEDEGILNIEWGDAVISDSAIVENTGGDDTGSAGISWASDGTLDISNVTIADNVASEGYAGIFYADAGTVNLDSVTVARNVSATGVAGIFNDGATVNVTNSIIAGNHSGTGDDDCSPIGTLTFAGGANTSILGVDNGCAAGDTPKSGDAGLDPLRASNRTDGKGVTWIVPLEPGSPALDSGATTLTTDQRGVSRPQGSAPDIGAVEMRSRALGVTLAAGQSLIALNAPAELLAVARNTGDFGIPAASLAFGLPPAFLAFAPPAAGANCAGSASGATCDLGALAGEDERVVGLSATAKAAGTTTATATLAATGLTSASASVPLTIVGGTVPTVPTASLAPASGVCARNIVRVRVAKGSARTSAFARVTCRIALNNTGTYGFRFSKGKAKGNWAMFKGSYVAGKKTATTRTSASVKNTKAGRRVFMQFLMPTKARSVPLTVKYTAPSGAVTPQTLK